MILNDAQWIEVSTEGEATKHKYIGRFKIKPFLTHREKADAIRLAERNCRGIVEDLNNIQFQRLLAFLKFYIVEVDADWWKNDGLDLYDESPIYELLKQLRKLQGVEDEESSTEDKE